MNIINILKHFFPYPNNYLYIFYIGIGLGLDISRNLIGYLGPKKEI